MQAVQKIQNIDLQNLVNLSNSNNDSMMRKKIRTFYSGSKYKYIFEKENKKIKAYLNRKYWVVIQLEKLDENLLDLFDVIITQVVNNDVKEIYQINKSNNMTLNQLALLCDENNLKYGFSYIKEGNYIVINKNELEHSNIEEEIVLNGV